MDLPHGNPAHMQRLERHGDQRLQYFNDRNLPQSINLLHKTQHTPGPEDDARVLPAHRDLQTAMHTIQEEVSHVRKGTIEEAKCIHMSIKLDHEYLLEDVTGHD